MYERAWPTLALGTRRSRIKPGGEGERQSQRSDFRACIFSTRCSIMLQLDWAQNKSCFFPPSLGLKSPLKPRPPASVKHLQIRGGGGEDGSYYLPWQTTIFLHFQFYDSCASLGHSICSINDTEYAVGCTNPGKGGGRGLGQRGANPDSASSLCLPGPLHWACFPEPSRPVSG